MADYERGLSAKEIFDRDVRLSRLAANILGLAAGDSLRIPSDGELQFSTDFSMKWISATNWGFYLGSDLIMDFLQSGADNVREWRLWNKVASDAAAQSPILDLYNYKGGEVACRLNRAVDNTGTGAMTDNAWVIHIPPSLVAGDFHLNITRDGLGNYLALDSAGKVSIGKAIGNTDDGIARFGVVGGEDEVQAIIRGYSTQTSDIFQAQTSAALALFSVANSGLTIVRDNSARNIFLHPNSGTLGGGAAADYFGLRLSGGIGYFDSGQSIIVNADCRGLGSKSIDFNFGSTPALTLRIEPLNVSLGTDGKITFNPSAAAVDCILPATDARGQIGNATYRFSLVRAVTITSGDFVFENGWKMTEAERLGLGEGIALVKPNGEVAQVWR